MLSAIDYGSFDFAQDDSEKNGKVSKHTYGYC